MKNQIAPEVKEKREKALALEEEVLRKSFMNQFIGEEMDVLFEKHQEGYVAGYTSNYLRVQVAGDESIENTIRKVKIEKQIDGHTLYGKLV